MPATVNVNKLSVVHAGSSGMAMSFPDVCKTPTPGGPIPIPYPNIAQSSDTADGSSTVKVDGNPIMLKSSNFRMSSGDEAGSAMGVVSNKIKGKAVPVNASFDVKVDGTNVFRLTDPMQTNTDASSNSMNAAEVQAPLPEGTFISEECKKIKDKREAQPESVSSQNSGMHPDHFAAIKQVAQDVNAIFYFRASNSLCIPWITLKHQPKPHSVFTANTIKPPQAGEVTAWLKKFEAGLREKGMSEIAIKARINAAADPKAQNVAYATEGSLYEGAVGKQVGDGLREPLKAVAGGVRDSGRSYAGKWITGDYDLFQVLWAVEGCKEIGQKSRSFIRIRRAINKACDWDAIQHGPQAQWVPSASEKAKTPALANVNFPSALKGALASGDPNAVIKIPGRTDMNVVDEKVTVIAPGGSVYLEKKEDTMDALKCRECEK